MALDMGREESAKWELASEICNLSKGVPCCSHRSLYPTDSTFIDWYLLLNVDESVGVDVIKQRYRKLALQLHPDKNKHPKADIAFKLLSQAYVCLTDEASREAFDIDRRNHACAKCSTKSSEKPSRCGNVAKVTKTFPPMDRTRPVSRSISQRVKELTARFMEEVAVINTCLKAKSSPPYSTNRPETFRRQNEIPIFDPANYELQGYPHPSNYRKLLHRFQESSTEKPHVSGYPLFEPRSEKDAYVHRFSRTSSKHMFYN